MGRVRKETVDVTGRERERDRGVERERERGDPTDGWREREREREETRQVERERERGDRRVERGNVRVYRTPRSENSSP